MIFEYIKLGKPKIKYRKNNFKMVLLLLVLFLCVLYCTPRATRRRKFYEYSVMRKVL
jgi:hypothetical protein